MIKHGDIEAREVKPIFDSIMADIALMLEWGIIHGDLSAYNVLYWDGKPTLIDFPQIVDPHQNDAAFDIFTRDVTRICEYFSKYGISADGPAVSAGLWTKYVTEVVSDKAADSSTAAAAAERYRADEELDAG